MKTLIIADTHLTKIFEPVKYEFLQKTIRAHDNVIINGDFWDSWYTTIDEFINSKWNKLFPLLLEKHCVYIYGNHDPKELNNQKISLFSVKQEREHLLKIAQYKFRITHGSDILEQIDRGYFLNQYRKFVKKIHGSILGSIIYWLLDKLEIIGYLVIGYDKMKSSRLGEESNKILKASKKSADSKNDWLICSDTHTPELDIQNKYANTGNIEHEYASYIVIDGNGEVNLYSERY